MKIILENSNNLDVLGKFIDLDSNNAVDIENKERLNKLKHQKLPNAYQNSANLNIVTYTVGFKE